jgi:hypothetical protein
MPLTIDGIWSSLPNNVNTVSGFMRNAAPGLVAVPRPGLADRRRRGQPLMAAIRAARIERLGALPKASRTPTDHQRPVFSWTGRGHDTDQSLQFDLTDLYLAAPAFQLLIHWPEAYEDALNSAASDWQNLAEAIREANGMANSSHRVFIKPAPHVTVTRRRGRRGRVWDLADRWRGHLGRREHLGRHPGLGGRHHPGVRDSLRGLRRRGREHDQRHRGRLRNAADSVQDSNPQQYTDMVTLTSQNARHLGWENPGGGGQRASHFSTESVLL